MSILNKLSGLTAAADHVAVEQKPMTPEQRKKLAEGLRASNRMNVYPNQFDSNVPYRVQTRKQVGPNKYEYTEYGRFTDVDVAAAVGSLVSASIFGAKALRGNFDQAVAEAHPEFIAWLADERNAAVLAKVG